MPSVDSLLVTVCSFHRVLNSLMMGASVPSADDLFLPLFVLTLIKCYERISVSSHGALLDGSESSAFFCGLGQIIEQLFLKLRGREK